MCRNIIHITYGHVRSWCEKNMEPNNTDVCPEASVASINLWGGGEMSGVDDNMGKKMKNHNKI